MVKKCKICGYRFKSPDEAICPECFTARDDDISCEQYSANEHSHRKSVSSGLGDSGESFVQSELREERRNQFAKENFANKSSSGLNTAQPRIHDASRFTRSDYNSPPQTQQQTAYQRYISQVQRKQGGTPSGFTPAGQRIAQQSAAFAPRPISPAGKKKNSAAAVVFLLIFIMIFVGIISVAAGNTMNESQDHTETQQTTVKTAALNTGASSERNIYDAQVLNIYVEDVDSSQIPDYLMSKSTDYTGEADSWKMVTISVRINRGEAFTTEQAEASLTAAYLYGFEYPDMRKQISSSSVSVHEKIDVPDGGRDMSVKLLAHEDASYVNFYFTLSCKINGVSKPETCRFKLELPE